MKFQPERMDGLNAIRAYAADSITVNQQTWRGSVIVPFKGEPEAWDCLRFEDIAERHFEALVALQPELVVVGSGRQHRFVPPVLARSLLTRRIGVESMDTSAACRTYNILAGEGRRVVAMLLLD